jgi:ribonuclease P protein component
VKRADFELVYKTGARQAGRLMTVLARARPSGEARLGIAATRKLGGAVTRNRAKRLVRELFRQHKPAAALDLVVVPRREMLDAPYARLEEEFRALVERHLRRGSWRGSASNH